MQAVMVRKLKEEPIYVSDHEEFQASLRVAIIKNQYTSFELDRMQNSLYSELHRLQDEVDAILNELRVFLLTKNTKLG